MRVEIFTGYSDSIQGQINDFLKDLDDDGCTVSHVLQSTAFSGVAGDGVTISIWYEEPQT